jgi:hypothetical protein
VKLAESDPPLPSFTTNVTLYGAAPGNVTWRITLVAEVPLTNVPLGTVQLNVNESPSGSVEAEHFRGLLTS